MLTGSGGAACLLIPAGPLQHAGRLGDGSTSAATAATSSCRRPSHETGNPYKWLRALERARAPSGRNGSPTPHGRTAQAAKLDEMIPKGSGAPRCSRRREAEARRAERRRDPADAAQAERAAAGRRSPSPSLRRSHFPRTIPSTRPRRSRRVAATAAAARRRTRAFRRYLHLPDAAPSTSSRDRDREPHPPSRHRLAGPSSPARAGQDRGPRARRPPRRARRRRTDRSLTPVRHAPQRPREGINRGPAREIGDQAMLVLKDFGSIRSCTAGRAPRYCKRSATYTTAATPGTSARRRPTLDWSGRVGLLAGATTVLDQAHAAHVALGERCLILRLVLATRPHGEAHAAGMDTADDAAELATPYRASSRGWNPLAAAARARPRGHARAARRLVASRTSPSSATATTSAKSGLFTSRKAPAASYGSSTSRTWRSTRWASTRPGTLVGVGLDSIPVAATRGAPTCARARRRHIGNVKTAGAFQLPTVSGPRALEELAAHGLSTRHKAGDADNSTILWAGASSAHVHWQKLRRYAVKPAHGWRPSRAYPQCLLMRGWRYNKGGHVNIAGTLSEARATFSGMPQPGREAETPRAHARSIDSAPPWRLA